MFAYQISPILLRYIKEIHLVAADLNRHHLSRVVLFEMENEALTQSSYSSTSIEGNPIPLTEVRKILKNRPQSARDTEREVLQYNDTLVWLNSEIQNSKFDMNEKNLIRIHSSVMKSLLPKVKLGSFRREPVLVNDPKARKPIFWPPDHKDVRPLIKNLTEFIKAGKNEIDPLILAGIFHKQFVLIHPFIDGNGRTVRLATKSLLASLGLNTFALFSFESYYNRNVSKYFKFVGERGDFYDLQKTIDFTPWLEYFCEGVLDELLRVKKSIEIGAYSDPKDKLNDDQEKIIKYLHDHGYIKDSDYALFTKRAKATRTLDFKKLIDLKLIEKFGKGPATYYRLKVT